MSDETHNPSESEHVPWLERIGFILFLSWVSMATVLAFESWCRNSLESRTDYWLYGLMFYGGIIGTYLFVLQIMLPGVAIYGFGTGRRWSRGTKCRLVLLLTTLVVIYNLSTAVSWRLIACEPSRFADITSMTWPEKARCVKALHGFGFQDRRHLWVFEGTSEEFLRHKTQLPWGGGAANEEGIANAGSQRLPMHEVESAFKPEGSWEPGEVYNWMVEKDTDGPAPGVYGPAWLFVNAEHTRWCVWWDGI